MVSKAKLEANNRYDNKAYHKINLRLRKGDDDDIINAIAVEKSNGGTNRATLRKWYEAYLREEGSTVTYQVELRDSTGATFPIETVMATKGYTAEQYVADCQRNADDNWNEMLADGEVIITEI